MLYPRMMRVHLNGESLVGLADGVEEAGMAVGLQVPSVPELSGCWSVSELGSHPDESLV